MRWTKVETNGPGGHATVELQPENVVLSVCLSVYRHFSKKTAPRISTKLGQKLEGDE